MTNGNRVRQRSGRLVILVTIEIGILIGGNHRVEITMGDFSIEITMEDFNVESVMVDMVMVMVMVMTKIDAIGVIISMIGIFIESQFVESMLRSDYSDLVEIVVDLVVEVDLLDTTAMILLDNC
ncbi:uncharacterized protein A4U43_C08F15010 [Asparagus officinalis]|nr:uncharacterized protein A4U43_C08F15010 [Asparagus officinalis]